MGAGRWGRRWSEGSIWIDVVIWGKVSHPSRTFNHKITNEIRGDEDDERVCPECIVTREGCIKGRKWSNGAWLRFRLRTAETASFRTTSVAVISRCTDSSIRSLWFFLFWTKENRGLNPLLVWSPRYRTLTKNVNSAWIHPTRLAYEHISWNLLLPPFHENIAKHFSTCNQVHTAYAENCQQYIRGCNSTTAGRTAIRLTLRHREGALLGEWSVESVLIAKEFTSDTWTVSAILSGPRLGHQIFAYLAIIPFSAVSAFVLVVRHCWIERSELQ